GYARLAGGTGPALQPAPVPSQPVAVGVGKNVHVSAQRRSIRHWETVVAAHPRDPGRLVAASMYAPDRPNWSRISVYVSTDGGASWQPGHKTAGRPDEFTADPAVAFGPDGDAYLAYCRVDMAGRKDGDVPAFGD